MTMATSVMNPSSSASSEQVDERLVAQAALDAAEERLRSLCAQYAGTFVSVERRGVVVQSSLKKLLEHVKDLLEHSVEDAQHALTDDDEKLAKLSEKHRVRRRTLLQHSSLLELLELPTLMDACVRSNLYEEALQIASFGNALERRDQHNKVVENVVQQIRSRQIDLRRHLLHRLKQDVTMPQCLEAVTALRRLNSIDLEILNNEKEENLHASLEYKLQVDFLEARDAWLNQVSVGRGTSSSEQLLDTIERYRTRVFEIATQFNSIFRATPTTTGQDSHHSPTTLLSMWTTRRVHSFLSMLQYTKFNDSAEIRDVLEASTFFATSVGRFGADFSSQLGALLEPHMVQLIVVQHWNAGVNVLQETLQVCRDAGVASPLVSQTAIASITTTTQDSNVVSTDDDLDELAQPPRSLLALPALARLVNSFLGGLNELRRCLLPGLFVVLRRELRKNLESVTSILQTNQRAVMTPGLRGQAAQLREVAESMNKLFESVATPYLLGALELALGNTEVARNYLKQKEEEPVQEEEVVEEEEETAEEPAAAEEEEVAAQNITETAAAAPEALQTVEEPAAVVQPSGSNQGGDGWDEDADDIYD